MKQNNKNKNYSDDLTKEDNLTQDQENLDQETILNDNLSDEEEYFSDEEGKGDEKTLQEKYDELNDSYLRLHAEYDNYRKRTLKEKMEIIKTGGEKVLTEMIPLIDDLSERLKLFKMPKIKAIAEGLN